jgi:3-phosphoshikimate 1-carboxyvinyltransferase
LALGRGRYVVDGDQHMRKRPIQPLVDALRTLGVKIDAPTGCPPVTINAEGRFSTNRVVIDAGLSSQYVSALLMAAPLAGEDFTVALSGDDLDARGYVDLTLAAMRSFGAAAENVLATQWRVQPTGYLATDFRIEPDASAATYLWAADVLTGGAIDLGATSFTQPDAKAKDVIESFPHMPAVIDGSQMQDAVPTLAVLAAFNETPVRFVGISNLRVKECDRIRALSLGLNRIAPGLAREEGDDLIVDSTPGLAGQSHPAEIDTFADHRIAMSFALAGLKIRDITILDPDCVSKTYPGYWQALGSLGVSFA